jgi:hypothetical protein
MSVISESLRLLAPSSFFFSGELGQGAIMKEFPLLEDKLRSNLTTQIPASIQLVSVNFTGPFP